MAAKCAHCGSVQTQHEVNEIFCFNCGRKTSYEGKKVESLKKPQ